MPLTQDRDTRTPTVPWHAVWRANGPGFDEVGTPEARPVWAALGQTAELGDLAALAQCHVEARRLIRDLGVSYTVYGRGDDQRPWTFDPLPFAIDAREWHHLEAGLIQRARLMEALLADCYGAQRLLATAVLPPQILYANPWFQRLATGIAPPGGRWLHLYAVDLQRGPDGQWRCIADRTQAPSGMGYALANRIVSVRAAPQAVAQVKPAAMIGFFERLSRLGTDLVRAAEPTVAVLSPGPYNETYFEHAYLARQLGFVLARGQDLVVRDETVFLDTLAGLRRVDVLLRRLDDDFCDPLELRADSQLGVAGLVQAARAGRVVLANPIGSGVVEAPALHPFLPAIAEALLGERLMLPSIATVWDPAAVLACLDTPSSDQLIRPAFATPGFDAMAGARQGEDVRRRPAGFVVQPRLAHSVVPVLGATGVEPRPMQLRCFLLQDRDGWSVLPGGLVRYGARGEDLTISMQTGGGAKDAWLIGTGAPGATARQTPPITIRRAIDDLSSRVADNLFWTGRYIERADAGVRLARAALARLAEADRTWERAAVLTALARVGMPLQTGAPLPSLAGVMTARHGGQFGASVQALGRVTFDLRDRVSLDLGRLIASVVDDAGEPARGAAMLGDKLDRWLETLSAIQGLMAENLVRGIAWRFLETGRRLERAMQTADTVATLIAPGQALDAGLGAALEIADSQLTYRWRYPTGLSLPAVIDLVVLDDANPRSILFQLQAIEAQLAELPGGEREHRPSPLRRVVAGRIAQLHALPVESLSPALTVDALAAVWRDLAALSDRLTDTYFRPGAAA